MKTIIKHLRENWIRHGFETLVVTVGILAAFGLNNWNENRKERILEIKYLKRLKTDLVHDSIYFNLRIVNAQKYRTDYAKAIHLAYETQHNLAELKELLSLYSWSSENLTIQGDTYTELTSAGNLNILQSDTLKNAIIAYYRLTNQAGKHILEFNNFTASMAVYAHQLTNLMKYHPYSSGLFTDEMLFDSDWRIMNDPSSEAFKYWELLAATYSSKEGVFVTYFLDSKSRSKSIIQMLEKEIARFEGQ